MQKKMQQFLYSIGLEDVERFDMDFVLVAMNPYQKGKVDMAIEKEEPWDYFLLEEFMQAASKIRYPFSIRFSYGREVTPDDVGHLLLDWHLALYHDTPDFITDCPRKGIIAITFTSEEKKERDLHKIRELRELFAFINYPYQVGYRVDKRKTEPAPMEEQPQEKEEVKKPPVEEAPKVVAAPNAEEEKAIDIDEEIEKEDPSIAEAIEMEEALDNVDLAEEEVIPEAIEEAPKKEKPAQPEPSKEDIEELEEVVPSAEAQEELEKRAEDMTGEELIERDKAQFMEDAEVTLLRQKKENFKAMMEARNSKRVWTVGDYRPVRSIKEIFDLPLCNVDFAGVIYEGEAKMSRKGKLFGTFGIGDQESAISLRVFAGGRVSEETVRGIKKGEWFRIRGAIDTDRFSGQRTVMAHFVDPLPAPESRKDPEEVKRVELHLHTNMSTMDGVGEPAAYINLAAKMGMDAIAITDHGSIQSFPNAQIAARKAAKSSGHPFKLIYGAELYLFDKKPTYETYIATDAEARRIATELMNK